MTNQLVVRIAAGPRAPGEARARLAPVAPALDPSTFEDLTLLVSELVTNSYRHGKLRFGQQIEIAVEAGPRTLHVEVIDHGRGFETRRSRETRPAPMDAGWGLFLVDRIADRWGVGDDGVTRVWFEKDLRRAAPRKTATASRPR